MRFWFSPLPLPAALISELAAAGLEPWPNNQGSPHGDICLLVYDSPERHIAAAAEADAVFSSAALAEGYSQLLGCREASSQPLLAGWRLQRVGVLGLQQWLAGNGHSNVVGDAEPINSLVASVILSLVDTQPQLLEAYNDLELQAELLGSEADLTYRQRLHQAIVQADPLQQLLAALQTREGELEQARQEAESTRLELHRVKEELKQLVLADGQRQQMLDTRNDELKSLQENIQALQQELRPKVDSMEQQLQTREKQLQDSRDAAEVTLHQLHQVQEELKLLVLADEQKQQLLDIRNQELLRLQERIQALQQELQSKVDNMEKQHKTLEKLLQDTRDDAELTLLQLHQAHEELEQLFLADQQKRQLVDARDQELHNLRAEHHALEQELQPKVTKLEQQIHTRDKQLQDTREAADLTLLQLHQIQEELEQLFLVDRQKQQLLDSRKQELHNLQGQLQNRDRDLLGARDDAERTLLHLHQVQEELKQLDLADRQKQQLLETHSEELQSLQGDLEALQQELQTKVLNLEKQLQNRDRDLLDARDDSELIRLQLHQVQEELERYFLQTRACNQLVEAQADQLHRSKRLLAKLAMSDFSPSGDVATIPVEVLPPTDLTSQQPSLQVQALLKAYASNLDRASALLARAMRR
jgi:DNA repair exonuclease SbcCD ATPase subunit